jgi:hypothetical protein
MTACTSGGSCAAGTSVQSDSCQVEGLERLVDLIWYWYVREVPARHLI